MKGVRELGVKDDPVNITDADNELFECLWCYCNVSTNILSHILRSPTTKKKKKMEMDIVFVLNKFY